MKIVRIGIILLALLSVPFTYDKGFEKGADKMFIAVTDTIQSILNKQIKSDTSESKLIIINPDTNVYYIRRKDYLKN